MASVFEEPGNDVSTDEDDMQFHTGMSSARRALIACAAAALCMAAGGLWLIPSDDAAMQLIKLMSSVILLLGGLILFHGLNDDNEIPEIQVDPNLRQLRVYHYDSAGRSVLKACHNIDNLQGLSVQKQRLRAKGSDGRIILDIPLGCADQANAIRGMLPSGS